MPYLIHPAKLHNGNYIKVLNLLHLKPLSKEGTLFLCNSTANMAHIV